MIGVGVREGGDGRSVGLGGNEDSQQLFVEMRWIEACARAR